MDNVSELNLKMNDTEFSFCIQGLGEYESPVILILPSGVHYLLTPAQLLPL